jgi:hypothetical protein
LFIASNTEILETVLGPAPANPLANDPDFVAVTAELKKFLPAAQPQLVGLAFSRPDQMMRDDYDLFRAGKMPESETVLGRLLDQLYFVEGRTGPREKKLDGKLLPPFEQVRHYFAPVGVTMRATPDGWTFLLLSDESVAPAKGAAPAAN